MTKFWGCVIEEKTKRTEYWLELVKQNLRFSNDLIQNNLKLEMFDGKSKVNVQNELEKIYITELCDRMS